MHDLESLQCRFWDVTFSESCRNRGLADGVRFFMDKLSKNCLLLGYGSFLYALFICKDFLDMLIFESQRNQGFPKFTGYMV